MTAGNATMEFEHVSDEVPKCLYSNDTSQPNRIKRINALIESHEIYSEEEDEKNYNLTKIAFAIWLCGLIAIIVGAAVYSIGGKFGASGPVFPSVITDNFQPAN